MKSEKNDTRQATSDKRQATWDDLIVMVSLDRFKDGLAASDALSSAVDSAVPRGLRNLHDEMMGGPGVGDGPYELVELDRDIIEIVCLVEMSTVGTCFERALVRSGRGLQANLLVDVAVRALKDAVIAAAHKDAAETEYWTPHGRETVRTNIHSHN